MQEQDRQFEGACAQLYIVFFEKFPNNDMRDRVSRTLAMLLKRQRDFPGEPGGCSTRVFSTNDAMRAIPENP